MQVAHQNDHVTHAVIGGKQNIEFGISSSAEFFNILSSTLYKDQILAVVREVLCNAWDAHIEAGCTDRPVQITLEQDKFVIKDFGKGIHHDDMGLIYGTYGNSTKKNDGQQTGGFGLGCKAPFAYTDHFEVISCHAGTRTIYNLSKSSAQAMGKPGIIPIASFPTTETGLTVSIRLKQGDYRRFDELVHRIVRNGDMNMHLNGTQLDTIDFDTSKHNFYITRDTLLDAPTRIMVRYGNVIYPVDSAKNEAAYGAIIGHLDKLRGAMGGPRYIVFQAPPHSIAVTPSRESLSMQEHTISTLKSLFEGFLASLDKEFFTECGKYTEESIQEAVANQRIDELLKRDEALPAIAKLEDPKTISDFEAMAKVYMTYNYPKKLTYRKEDIARRLEAMVQAGMLVRGRVATFLRELKTVQKECTSHYQWHVTKEHTEWLQRRILAPLMSKLTLAGLSSKKLYVCNSEDSGWKTNYREGVPPLVPAAEAKPHHLLTTLPYLRNIVVLTTRRHGLVERAYEHEVFKKHGRYQGYLVYVVGLKKGEIEEARQFFGKQGMQVADLTVKDPDEVVVQVRSTTPRKPAKKGIVQLSSLIQGTGINTQKLNWEDATRIEAPEFVVQVSFRQGTSPYMLGDWDNQNSYQLVRVFGAKGGVTNSTATYDKWIEKGAVSFDQYVREKICSYILNNPRFEEYQAYHGDHLLSAHSRQSGLINAIYSNELLAKEFGLINPLTDEDKLYLRLWMGLKKQYGHYTPNTEIIKVKDWLNGIPAGPVVDALSKQFTSPLISFMDVSQFSFVVRHGDPAEVAQAITFLKAVLNP